jgi:hypothetical protein
MKFRIILSSFPSFTLSKPHYSLFLLYWPRKSNLKSISVHLNWILCNRKSLIENFIVPPFFRFHSSCLLLKCKMMVLTRAVLLAKSTLLNHHSLYLNAINFNLRAKPPPFYVCKITFFRSWLRHCNEGF